MEQKNFKKIILLDLDGVLNTYNGNYDKNNIPPIREGVETFLQQLSKNHEIKIFTARTLNSVKKWLIENDISRYVSGITNKKEPCWLMIDDRCITFDGNYQKLIDKVENFQPWYKK